MEATTGHPKLHSTVVLDRLSRYNTRSHQAGIRFFSPESYPKVEKGKYCQRFWLAHALCRTIQKAQS